jgi:hypothetical protein
VLEFLVHAEILITQAKKGSFFPLLKKLFWTGLLKPFLAACAVTLMLSGCGDNRSGDSADISQDNTDVPAVAEETDPSVITVDPSGIISANGLQWRVGPDRDLSWNQAFEWVNSLGGGWRVPSIGELEGLWNAGVNNTDWGPFRNNGFLVWSGNHTVFCFFSGDVFQYPQQAVAIATRAFAVRSPD